MKKQKWKEIPEKSKESKVKKQDQEDRGNQQMLFLC